MLLLVCNGDYSNFHRPEMKDLASHLNRYQTGTYENPLAVLGLGLILLFTAFQTWLLSGLLLYLSGRFLLLVWGLLFFGTTLFGWWLLRRARLHWDSFLYGFPLFASKHTFRTRDLITVMCTTLAGYLLITRFVPTEWVSIPLCAGSGFLLYLGLYSVRAHDVRYAWMGLFAFTVGLLLHPIRNELSQTGAIYFAVIGFGVLCVGVLDVWDYKRKLKRIGGSDV